jgi:hypothetical protein
MAEGMEPINRFVASYGRHAAGVDHDLVVIYKGFNDQARLNEARSALAAVPHAGFEMSDSGFDIGAYLGAAGQLDHDYVFFANTFTEIASDGWLACLHEAACVPGVGLAGAMGSYESLYSTMALTHKIIWLCNDAAIGYDDRIAHYYDFIVDAHCRLWKAKGEARPYSPRLAVISILKKYVRRWRSSPSLARVWDADDQAGSLDAQFEHLWNHHVSPGQGLDMYSRFPAFPNPHIRSNGFMIARTRLLQLGFTAPQTKLEAWEFESGMDSMTRRIQRVGLSAVVVDKDGRRYESPDWARSATFRLDNQQGLLLTDNQSREFPAVTPGTRATLARLTWGDSLGDPPAGFPDLGFKFAIDNDGLLRRSP